MSRSTMQALSATYNASTAPSGRPVVAPDCPSGPPARVNDFAPVGYFQPSATDGITGSRKRPLEADDKADECSRKRASLSYSHIVKQPAIIQSSSPGSIINRRKHRQEINAEATKHQAPTWQSGIPYNIKNRQYHRPKLGVEVANDQVTVSRSNNPSSLINSREHRPKVVIKASEDSFQRIKLQRKQVQDAEARNLVNGDKYDGNFLNSCVSVKAAPAAGMARAIVPRKRGTEGSTTSRPIKDSQVKDTLSESNNFFASSTATSNADTTRGRQRDAQVPRCHHEETEHGLGPESNLIGNIGIINELFKPTDYGDDDSASPHYPKNLSRELKRGAAAGTENLPFGNEAKISKNTKQSLDAQKPIEAAGHSACGNGEGTESLNGLFETEGEFDRFVDESVDGWDIFRNTEHGVHPFQSESQAAYPDIDLQKELALTPLSPLPQAGSTVPEALLHPPGSTHYLSEALPEALKPFPAAGPDLLKSTPDIFASPPQVAQTTEAQGPQPSSCHIEGFMQSVYGISKHIYDANGPIPTYQPLRNATDPTQEDRIFLDSYYLDRPAAAGDLEEDVLLLRPLIEEMGAIPASRKSVPILTLIKK